MICFDVSALLKAQLGESLILNVDTGPQKLTGGSTEVLEVDFFRGTIQVLCIQNGLFVEGSIKSQFGLDCARCLEPFAFPVTLELGETFRLPRTDPRPDAPYAVGDDHKLDLAPLLREQTWIAIPMKPGPRIVRDFG